MGRNAYTIVRTKVVTRPTDYAVLDVQWSPHSHRHGGEEILAVATSTGRIELFQFTVGSKNGSTQVDFVRKSAIAVAEESLLVLSLAWHPELEDVIGVTLSDGSVRLCRVRDGQEWKHSNVEMRQTAVHRHDLEAWTLAFTRQASGTETIDVLSGGDDAVLKFSSISTLLTQSQSPNSDDMEEVEAAFAWQDRRIHQAGVTAILPLTYDLVVTGSYDDHIRLLSCPKVGRRKVLAEANLGGGVWRLKDITSSGTQKGDDESGSRRYVFVFHLHSFSARSTAASTTTGCPLLPHEPSPSRTRSFPNEARTRISIPPGHRQCQISNIPTSAVTPADISHLSPTPPPAHTILASCMHAGARIVRLCKGGGADGDSDAGEWRIEVLWTFEEHASMNYGGDVQPVVDGEADGVEGERRIVVSTSFYDRLVCMWKVEVPSR